MSAVTTTESARARTVEASMARRRAAIIAAARELIAETGPDALSMRRLANHAGVSVPTLYNLIGHRDEVIAAATASEPGLATVRFRVESQDPVNAPARLLTALIDELAVDEVRFRAELRQFDGSADTTRLPARLGDAARALADTCAQLGLLAGELPLAALTAQLERTLLAAHREWAIGQLDLTGLRQRVLADAYWILAADVAEPWRGELLARLRGYAG